MPPHRQDETDNNFSFHKTRMVFENRNGGGRVNLRKKGSISIDGGGFQDLQLPTFGQREEELKPRFLPTSKINWGAYLKSGNAAIVFWIILLIVMIFFFAEEPAASQELNGIPSRHKIELKRYKSMVFIKDSKMAEDSSPKKSENASKYRGHLYDQLPRVIDPRGSPDVGNLKFSPRRDGEFSIAISPKDGASYEKFRSKMLKDIDEHVSSSLYPLSDRQDEFQKCRMPEWAGSTFPTCNQVHEIVTERPYDGGQLQDFEVHYLNSGTYRDAWRFKRSETDHIVLKRMILASKHTWGAKDMYKIHKEAMIMERLSHSPRVLNIHAFCGTSVHVDAMRGDLYKKIITGTGFAPQSEMDKLDNDHLSQNEFTPSEKLQISLEMAESLADLHGYEGGPIKHADTHIEQWLIAPDGSIKLNDFNNAHEPTWNAEKGEYCETKGSYGGVYRSPEEFRPSQQDESVDVFAYGNNVYTLITGLWPFYDEEYREMSHSALRDEIVHGKRPYVDPRFRNDRTYIESKLVEIMEKCWKQRRVERPKIFEVVEFLREVKVNASRIGELHPSDTIKIPMVEY